MSSWCPDRALEEASRRLAGRGQRARARSARRPERPCDLEARRRPRVVCAALLACVGALASASSGCEPEPLVFRTPLVFALPSGDADLAARCIGSGLDTYIVDLMAFEGTPQPVEGLSPCLRCTPATCHVVARACLCSGRRTDLYGIDEAASEFAFRDVDPAKRYCVRFMLLDRGDTGGSTEGPASECGPQAWCDRSASVPAEWLRVCAISDLGAVNESGAPIVVRTVFCSDPTLGICATPLP